MTIGMNISNKVKKYADEVEKRKQTNEAAAKILEGETEVDQKVSEVEPDQDIIQEQAQNDYVFTDSGIKIPKEIGVDFNSTNPVGELFKIDDYYKAQKNVEPEQQVKIELERTNEPTETEDDIAERIRASLDSSYNNKKRSTLDEFSRLTQAQADAKVKADANSKATSAKINDYYDQATEAASNNVLKRGLARSSIAVLEINGINKERAQELSKEAQSLSDQLSKIDDEIENLRAKQENALELLDLDYASDLATRISEETEKLAKKRQEAIEFNNNVTKLETELNLKKEKQDAELAEKKEEMERKAKEESGEMSEEDLAKVGYITQYLNALTRAQALNKLTSDNMFAYLLGDNWQSVYLNQLARPIDK